MGQTTVTLNAAAVKSCRAKLGLSQDGLANELNISKNSVIKAENGKPISVQIAKQLAEGFGVTVEELCGPTIASSIKDESSFQINCIPSDRTSLFGRESDLIKILDYFTKKSSLQNTNKTRRLIIYGWPGVGKTTLCKEISRSPSFRSLYPHGVFWCSLGPEPDVRSKLDALANAINIHQTENLDNATVANLIAGAIQDKSILIIIDDVYTSAHAEMLLLGGRKCGTIITTRFPMVLDQLSTSPGDEYRLGILDPDAALALLRELAPEAVSENEPLCKEVIETIERLPLSLQVLGRMVRAEMRKGKNAEDVLKKVLHSQSVILEQSPPSDIQAQLGDRAPSVMSLLNLSTDLLDEADKRYFMSLQPFAPKPAIILGKDLATFWEIDPDPILSRLVDRGLIEYVGEGRYQIHSLLVAHANALIDAEFEQ